MHLQELLGAVLASHLLDDGRATRVVVEEVTDIVGFVVDDDPAVFCLRRQRETG